MQDTKAFGPFYQVSQAAAAGAVRPSVTLATTAGGANASAVIPGNDSLQMQIANTNATSWAYVQFGVIRDSLTVVAAAVASSFPVPPNSVRVVSVDPEVNGASAIFGTGGATGNLIFTRGAGVG